MRRLLLCSLAVLSISCNGSGSSASWPDLVNKCANPRTGTDPNTSKPYPDQKGSATDEKRFLRAWSDDTYLWYQDLPKDSPDSYSGSVLSYFSLLKTPLKTASGNAKDKFHFTFDTAAWESLSQSGVEAGYGVTWALVARSPPRKAYAAYTEPSSPAVTAGITRGTEVVAVDGVAVVDGPPNPLNAGLFPQTVGETHTFTIIDRGATTTHDITMKSQAVTSAPVQHAGRIPNTTIGYILFNAHIGTAEKALADAITQLKAAGATDLVLDMRYNGGGYIYIASQLAYMIARPAATAGKTFERTVFNDKHPAKDPIYGDNLAPVPFYSTGSGLQGGLPGTTALPSLGLDRLYVLTGSGTCSASESVINGLLGVGVQVNLIGKTTCGKPYGFYPQDNCGTTYFSIQFQGQNAKGFGDYPDGFVPGGNPATLGDAAQPGCQVADDFAHELGDPLEARLAAALQLQSGGGCPAPTAAPRNALRMAGAEGDVYLVRNPFLENRIYWRPR